MLQRIAGRGLPFAGQFRRRSCECVGQQQSREADSKKYPTGVERYQGAISVVVSGFDERVQLPNLIRGQPPSEARHLRVRPAIRDGL